MKLDRLILINWGQLRPGNFSMGDMTLLTGETGAGKSTMLDGLQTIMTGANKGIMVYNPGQDEVAHGQQRGKSKRTLESYIVGAEYSNFSRKDGAQGYMAAVFRPSKGEEHLKPFTAVVGASARVEGTGHTRQARLESIAFVIVDDAALTFEDFIKDEVHSEYISVDRMVLHLQGKYPLVRDFNDKKLNYLCALYGRFRGKSSVTKDEAFNAAKAWVQSVAYRPIESVHELVRDEILDSDERQLQQDVERISGLMREVSVLKHESERLQSSVGKLTKLNEAIVTANKAHESCVKQGMLVAKLELRSNEEKIAEREKSILRAKELEDQYSQGIAALGEMIENLRSKRVSLEARLQGIPVHNQQKELEDALNNAKLAASKCLESLSQSMKAAVILEQRGRDIISKAAPESCNLLKISIDAVAQAIAGVDFGRLEVCQNKLSELSSSEDLSGKQSLLYELSSMFDGLNKEIDPLYEALVGQGESVLLALTSDASMVAQAKIKAEDRVKDLGSQRTRLAQGRVTYPPMVDRALTLINEHFPQANAQVLCDLVEPKSEKWQSAIESYIDGARFNLIVLTEWERQCIDLLRSKNIFNAKVIQGSLCLKNAETRRLPDDSIVHELRSENPIAWAYLVDQFGSVQKVANTEELRTIGRGVTLNNVASGSRTMFSMKDVTNVFGQKSRQNALERVNAEFSDAEKEADNWNSVKSILDKMKASLLGVTQPKFDALPLRESARIIDRTTEALASLDITEIKELRESLDIAVREEKIYLEKKQDAAISMSLETQKINSLEASIRGLRIERQTHLDEFERQIKAMKDLTEVNLGLNYMDLIGDVDAKFENRSWTLELAKSSQKELDLEPAYRVLDVRELLNEYNLQAKVDERFLVTLHQGQETQHFNANYKSLVELWLSVTKALDGLKSIGIYNNRQELNKAERSFHDVFTKQFCVEIKSRVDEGIRTLSQLNNELKNLKFGSDSFIIDWSEWVPLYKDYFDFFAAVSTLTESTEVMDLFGEVTLNEKHINIRDKLVDLLLNDDHEKATKELLRIADYRNYRVYDIINETENGGKVKLSEWGTGSGGQLETPAYIIRAAVVTSRLKIFDKAPSLKLLVNDESFSKMDEPRARAVLEFLRDKLDLQVISAMPTMKAGALKDEFNREYSFTRLRNVSNGELDFIFECDERIFKQDRMRALWERQRVLARQEARLLFDSANPEDEAETNPKQVASEAV